jgi:hypothetical protein
MITEATHVIRRSVEQALAPLLGKSLWACTRAADLAAFQFGKKREATDFRGRNVSVGEYALHVQCAWRITRPDQVVVGNADLYYPPDLTSEEIPPGFEWDKGLNRRDELLRLLFEDGKRQFPVRRVDVGNAGSLFISMDDGLSLEVLPNSSLTGEHWRLFKPRSEEPHFVFSGKEVGRE